MATSNSAVLPASTINGDDSTIGITAPIINGESITAPTNGPSSSVGMIGATETVPLYVQYGCDSCSQLQQQVNAYKKEQAFYSDLKKKITLTDALIRRYTTKCQEYDLQQRKVEELTRKLASSKRDCKLLEEQLSKTLKEIIPWKREKTKFMEEYENNKRKLTAAQDALMANQAGVQQYRIQINELEKTLTFQKKEASEAKNRVKNLQATLDKRRYNTEDQRNEITVVKKEKRKISSCLEKAKATILKLRSVLDEHNIRVPRMAPQFLPKYATKSDGIEGNTSDESMESVSDDADEDKDAQEIATPLNTQEKEASLNTHEKEAPYLRRIQSILERKKPTKGSLSSKPQIIGQNNPANRSRPNKPVVIGQIKPTNTSLPSKPGVTSQKITRESSSEDDISGSEMMSHVADEIEAQLNLTESQDDKKLQLKGTESQDDKKLQQKGTRTLDMQTRRKPPLSRKTARTTQRQAVKNKRDASTKAKDGDEAKSENRIGTTKQTKSVVAQQRKLAVENTRQSERLTTTTDSDSSDGNAKASIASRTRTRTQSQSGHSSAEKSPKIKPVVSSPNKSIGGVKSKKANSKPNATLKTRQQRNLSKKNLSVKIIETSTDSDSSNDEHESRNSRPRTRSQSQSGNSGTENTPPRKVNNMMKASATLSDTSDEETDKTRKVSHQGKNSTKASEITAANINTGDVKAKMKALVGETSDKGNHGNRRKSPSAVKIQNKSAGRVQDTASLSDTSDDERQPKGEKRVKTSMRKEESKNDPQSDTSDEELVAITLSSCKNSEASKMIPRQRRNTDTEFETNRYPRRSRRCKYNETKNEDAQMRAFYSDGDKPPSTKHRQMFNFRKCTKKAKKLDDSSDESEKEETKESDKCATEGESKESERCARDDSSSIFNKENSKVSEKCGRDDTTSVSDKEDATSAKDGNDSSERTKSTTPLLPKESDDNKNKAGSESSGQSVFLKIPSSQKGRHPIRAENLALSPEDSVFHKKFLKPISPVRSSPRKKRPNSSSGDDGRTNPFFPVRTTRRSVQNLTASFISFKRSSSAETSFQGSIDGEAGCSGVQAKSNTDGKDDVNNTNIADICVQANRSSLRSSQQDSDGKDANGSKVQKRSAAEAKLDVNNSVKETQCQSSHHSASQSPSDNEKVNEAEGQSSQHSASQSPSDNENVNETEGQSSHHSASQSPSDNEKVNETDGQSLHHSASQSPSDNEKVNETEGQSSHHSASQSPSDNEKVNETEGQSSHHSASQSPSDNEKGDQHTNKTAPTQVISKEEIFVPERMTRSRRREVYGNEKEKSEPKVENKTNNTDVSDSAESSSVLDKKSNEEVKFAAPIPTRSFYNRRRTRSMSSTSSCSDVSNQSDFVEQQSSLEGKNDSNSIEEPKRRTRSMSARRSDPPKPVRVTRSMSEPRKPDLKRSEKGTTNASLASPREECKSHDNGNKIKETEKTKRTRSKSKAETNDSEDGKVTTKKLKDAQSDIIDLPRTADNSDHNDEQEEELGEQIGPARRSTPSPGFEASHSPILEPFQNYVEPQERAPSLPRLFEEQDPHRHLSPVSPLLEPFQNFDGERSLSPLPISPCETPPLMDRPLSSLSLPDLPPLPPLVTPLPPSPLRSLLTRSTTRSVNQVRMVSPLTTPPPRAISPLANPPMPDAISPLKDDDSMDTVQQRLNLIPSPRNFHAVAPRHAVAVPPHPTGHLFQAARCLTNNFDKDEEQAGPSGICNVDKKCKNHNGEVPSSDDNQNARDHVELPSSETKQQSSNIGEVPSEDIQMSDNNKDLPTSQESQMLSNPSASTYNVKNADEIAGPSAEQDNSAASSLDVSPDIMKDESDYQNDVSEEKQVTDENGDSVSNTQIHDSSHITGDNKKHKKVQKDENAGSKKVLEEEKDAGIDKEKDDKITTDADNKNIKVDDEHGKKGKGSRKRKQSNGNSNSDKKGHLQDDKNTTDADNENIKVDDEQGKKGKGARKRKKSSGSTNSDKKGQDDNNIDAVPTTLGQEAVAQNDAEAEQEDMKVVKGNVDAVERKKKRHNSRTGKQMKDNINRVSANVNMDKSDAKPITRKGRRRAGANQNDDDDDSEDEAPQRRRTRSMRHSSSENKDSHKTGLDKCKTDAKNTIAPTKKSRNITDTCKDEVKKGNSPGDDVMKFVKPGKGKNKKVSAITQWTRSRKVETNQDLLEKLEKQGVVTSEKEMSKVKSTDVNAAQSKLTNVVQHKVSTKPCSNLMASSKRTVIMIPPTAVKVSGFKRSRSWQRRASEQNKAKTENDSATEAQLSVAAPNVSQTSSSPVEVSQMAVTSMSPPSGIPTANNTVEDVSPMAVTNMSPPSGVPTENNTVGDVASDVKVTNLLSAISNASSLVDDKRTKAERNESDNVTSPVMIETKQDDNVKTTRGKCASGVTVTNTTILSKDGEPRNDRGKMEHNSTETSGTGHRRVHTSTTLQNNTNSSSQKSPTVEASLTHTLQISGTLQQNSAIQGQATSVLTLVKSSETSVKAATSAKDQNQSVKMENTNTEAIEMGQATTHVVSPATAPKPASKIGNLWGDIAKENKKAEKAMEKAATEVWKTLHGNTGHKRSHMGASVSHMSASTRIEEQRKQGGRNMASAWGNFTMSGQNQQEMCRRRKKKMPDKIAAKHKKIKETDTPSTSMPYTKFTKEMSGRNDAHIQETLQKIASYKMGTSASWLVKRILDNFDYNALDLVPVVCARCATGNTCKDPVLAPTEEKIITAVRDWTKKNNCTTLIDCLLSFLRQTIPMTVSESAPQRKFALHSTYCRLYAILCLHSDNLQCARVFAYDLLRNNEPRLERLLLAVASSWPAVLFKQESVQASPVGSVIEAVVMQRLSKMAQDDGTLKALIHLCRWREHKDDTITNITQKLTLKALIYLCGWREHKDDTITNITQQLVAMIQDANFVQILNENDPNPTLNQMAFELSKAMELLAMSMGWEWSNDILIREHLWPVLKKWTVGLRSENGIKNGSACLVMKIIANVGILGLAKNKQSVSEVMKMLLAVLQQPSNIIPRCVQLYTADAILQLSAAQPNLSYPVLQKWCSNVSQNVPTSVTERIQVLGSWLVKISKR